MCTTENKPHTKPITSFFPPGEKQKEKEKKGKQGNKRKETTTASQRRGRAASAGLRSSALSGRSQLGQLSAAHVHGGPPRRFRLASPPLDPLAPSAHSPSSLASGTSAQSASCIAALPHPREGRKRRGRKTGRDGKGRDTTKLRAEKYIFVSGHVAPQKNILLLAHKSARCGRGTIEDFCVHLSFVVKGRDGKGREGRTGINSQHMSSGSAAGYAVMRHETYGQATPNHRNGSQRPLRASDKGG